MRGDLAGQRFGRLVAVEPIDERKGGSVVWRRRCDCGNGCLADDIDKQTDGSMFDIWLEDGHYIARRIREALGLGERDAQ